MPEGFRFRRNTGSARPAEDEWFIPYNAPSASKPAVSHSIGQSPAPVRSNSSNMLNYFSGSTSPGPLGEPRQSFKFPPLPPTPKSTEPSQFVAAERFPSGLRKVPSQGSLLGSSSMRSRLPSATSVPTGLTAPKMLFSPLAREVHGSSFVPASAMSSPGAADVPRQRTVSAPQRRSRHGYDTPPRRWDAPTVCDKLVFAKPSITPHDITPPGSPEDNDADSDVFSASASRVVSDGKKREAERDEWANYVKHRSRSRSFGNEAPRDDAPVVGNARARERDIERRLSGSRKRSSSLSRWIPRHSHTRSMGDLLSRPETERSESDKNVRKSFGFVKRGSNSTGTYSKESSGQPSPMFGDHGDPFHVTDVPIRPFPTAKGNSVEYKPGHGYSRSSPDLLQRAARRSAPGPPTRTLRVSNPPVRRQGVVIIGAEDATDRLPVVDFSKPLPPLPADSSPRVDIAAFESFSDGIGEAISPPTQNAPTFVEAEAPAPMPSAAQPSPAHARTYLAEQHRRSRTIKAFQSPSARNSLRAKPNGSPTPTSRVKTSPSASTSTDLLSQNTFSSPRKPTALEEAIKRSRASSVSTLDKQSYPMGQPTYKRPSSTIDEDTPKLPRILATAPSFTPGTALVYPITTEAVSHPQAGPAGLIVPPPLGSRNNSNVSTASKTTVYTDASEGWNRSGTSTPAAGRQSFEDSPSPDEEMSDKFKGLFYRTPRDITTPHIAQKTAPSSAVRSTFPSMSSGSGTPTGLGFGLENQQAHALRRQSSASGGTSDGNDTVELATPVFSPDTQAQQNAYLQYVEQSRDNDLRGYDVPEGPIERSRSIRTARRTLSLRSSNTPEFRLSPAPVRRPTLIATPPQPVNSDPAASAATGPTSNGRIDGHHRHQSFTVIPANYSPESDNADPDTSTDTILPANPAAAANDPHSQDRSTPGSSQPAFSPGTFGAGVEEVPNPLEVPIVRTPEIAQQHRTLPDSPVSPNSVYSNSYLRRGSAITTGAGSRYSAVPSFVHDFPSPPVGNDANDTSEDHVHSNGAGSAEVDHEYEMDAEDNAITTMTAARVNHDEPHESAFGQVVTGPPGAGKTTYCHGMHQFLTALGRRPVIVNLDPAVPNPPYPCAVNITEIITLEEVMHDYGLGPNGAMIYVMEHLEENMDWLVSRLDEVLGAGQGEAEQGDGGEADESAAYVIFDTPGQVELWTNHDSLKRVIVGLTKMDYRLVAVHLSDAHYITDASKFISVTLLALRAMAQLELPHVNVLSKIDLLASYGDLPFNLRYYAEARDLDYLLDRLEDEPGRSGHANEKMGRLNRAMVELLDDYGNVSFETLAVEDKKSMLKLLRVIDKSNGYIHLPGQTLPENHIDLDALPDVDELPDVDDVQERWGANRAVHDAEEEEEWQREWAVRGGQALGPAAQVVRMPEGATRPV